jgi:D-beta-D-heptose 7-phosphate kinase / D-beta-D-heptose 1-phosphate adenosyltransferase
MPAHAGSRLIDRFADLRVMVVGDLILDSYLAGAAGRMCREAPVPNISIAERDDIPGGAGNTAVNLAALGARVMLLGVIGGDLEGGLLRHALRRGSVETDVLLVERSRRTVVKHRIVAGSQLLLRFEQGDSTPIDKNTEQLLIARLAHLVAVSDAIVVADYDGGVITPGVIDALARLQREQPRVLVIDSRHRLPAYRHVGATAVKPNYEEVIELLGIEPEVIGRRGEQIARHADDILARTGARIAAVTLDSEGAILVERGRAAYRTWAAPARHSCVVGAGDTFVAALTLALAAGAPTETVAALASASAAVVVGKEGTATCSARELRHYVAGSRKYLHAPRQLAERVDFLRQQGRRIVFTNGCFDLLHAGHTELLRRARALGDVLIVAVNADDSIRRLKGPGRPINTLDDRLQVLAALDCVDHLIDFDGATCCDLVRLVRPDVFVKGANHGQEQPPEAAVVAALGGIVEILPFAHDCSTARLIQRIRQSQKSEVGDQRSALSEPVSQAIEETEAELLTSDL